jgi:uncharacterized membrane protein
MTDEKILKNLRTFLFGFSIFIFAGSILELSFLDHTREPEQWTPFFLIALGIVLAVLMLVKPTAGVLKVMRIGMWIIVVGGVIGMLIHVSGNLEEVSRATSFMQLLKEGLGGRNPFLAPGILSMAAVMSLAAGYKYPVKAK